MTEEGKKDQVAACNFVQMLVRYGWLDTQNEHIVIRELSHVIGHRRVAGETAMAGRLRDRSTIRRFGADGELIDTVYVEGRLG